MKIAFVLDDSLDKSDGVQQYILTLGNWYRVQGHEVHYIVGESERTDIPNIHSVSKNIRAKFNQNRMSTPLPTKRARIQKLFDEHEFDVLHVQLPYSPFLAARVIQYARPATAVVGTFHIIPFSTIESLATRTLALVLRRSVKRFDSIYSVSIPAQSFARKAFKVDSYVLPNAVNVQHFRAAKPFAKYNDDTVTIVFLGRLVERKGCMYLLQALELLHQKHKLVRVRVLICGKGPLLSKLEAFVKLKRLGNIVQFMGYVDESQKAKYLASADIAVFPSTGGESFGIVLIEAMAAGSRVVMGGNNAGYKSVLGEKTEQLVDPLNSIEFAKRLGHFISSQRARNAAYKWQQEHVRKYDVKIVGGHLLGTYETVIAKRRNTTHNNG